MANIVLETLKEKCFSLMEKEINLKKPDEKLSQEIDEIINEIRRIQGASANGASVGVDAGRPKRKKAKSSVSDKDSTDGSQW